MNLNTAAAGPMYDSITICTYYVFDYVNAAEQCTCTTSLSQLHALVCSNTSKSLGQTATRSSPLAVLLCPAGLGPVLVPLSSVIAGAAGVLPPHITAALQSLAPASSQPSQSSYPPPSAPIVQAPSASNLLQQAAVNQMLQQAAPPAPSATAGLAAHQATAGEATTAVAARLGGGAPGVAGGSLAALIPHVPHMTLPAHAAAASAAAAKSEITAPSAGVASATTFTSSTSLLARKLSVQRMCSLPTHMFNPSCTASGDLVLIQAGCAHPLPKLSHPFMQYLMCLCG